MPYTHNKGYDATQIGFAVGAKGSEVQIITSGGNITARGIAASSAMTVTGSLTVSGTVISSSGFRVPVQTSLTSANGSTAMAPFGVQGITPTTLGAGYTYYLTQPTAVGLTKTIFRDLTTGGATGPMHVITSGADVQATSALCTDFLFAGTTSNTSGPQDRLVLIAIGTTRWLLGAALTTGITAT